MPVNETVEVGAARVALPPPIAPSLPFHVAATTSADQPVQQQDAQEQAMQLPDQTTSSPSKVDSVSVPSAVRVGNRTVFTSKLPRQWSWKAFTSSARGDGVQFRHWVRANVEYSDYPYARFDVNLNPLSYTDDEYSKYLSMSEIEDFGSSLGDEPVSSLQEQLTQSNKVIPWSKGETDALVELARFYDLRWSVIIDRWQTKYNSDDRKIFPNCLRKVEDLQHRYYQIGSVLAQHRATQSIISKAEKIDPKQVDESPAKTTGLPDDAQATSKPKSPSPKSPSHHATNIEALQSARQLAELDPSLVPRMQLPSTGTEHVGAKHFDLAEERKRRLLTDRTWNRSRQQEREEEKIRAELRLVEAQLRKLKKLNKHLVPEDSTEAAEAVLPNAAANVGKQPVSTSLPGPKRYGSFVPREPIDDVSLVQRDVVSAFEETAPVPTAGNPYLQSGRLFPPAIEGHAGLNKSTLKSMEEILQQLEVPKQPIATKRSADAYDAVRKDALTLLILQKTVLRKEAELASKKSKLIVLQQQPQLKGDKQREAKSDGDGCVADAKPLKRKTTKTKRPRSDSAGSAGSTEAKKPRKKLPTKVAASAIPISLTSSVTSASLTASDPVVKVDSDKLTAKPGKGRKPRIKKK
mmetsp:Transcript_22733/g.52191  ORF Transcript_22733/g.52191 Transcript_22733/m.52191 type:complete len:634 (+) Transcript_22733:182-2083(+)